LPKEHQIISFLEIIITNKAAVAMKLKLVKFIKWLFEYFKAV